MSVPALRFKEFSGDWEVKKLGEITLKVGSGSTPRGGVAVYQTFGIPFIRSQNVNNEQLLLDDITFISEEINNQMKGSVVKPDDILLNITGASIGRSCVVSLSFLLGNVNQHVCIIRLKQDYASRFLQPYLSSSRGQKSISSTQVGSGREGLNFEAIRSFNLSLPALPEQTKIANFLTAVDKKISLLTQKATLLSQYKKGVMQQIFSQELRFKDDDGQEFPEWEERQADEVFMSVSNKNHNGDLPILAATQDKGMIYREDSGLDIKSSESSVKSYKIVEKGDFVISLRSFQGGIEYSNLMGICSPAYTVMKPKIEINNGYFKAFLKKEDFIERLNGLVIGIRDGKQISYSAFATLTLPYPAIKEQTKIANFLTAIDDKITNNQTQLNTVKQYKQGLLQQMFV